MIEYKFLFSKEERDVLVHEITKKNHTKEEFSGVLNYIEDKDFMHLKETIDGRHVSYLYSNPNYNQHIFNETANGTFYIQEFNIPEDLREMHVQFLLDLYRPGIKQ